MIVNKEDYVKIPGVEYDINTRWEQGIPHHPKSIELFESIQDIDYVFGDDSFHWKSGGDGDNGEQLMYLMDIHFDELDAESGKLNSNIKLFIDDIRIPSDVGYEDKEWIIVRDYDSAIDIIKKYKPQIISFDHDLGEDLKTGLDITKQLIEFDLENGSYIQSNFKYEVHSANPVGAGNIRGFLDGYIKHKRL